MLRSIAHNLQVGLLYSQADFHEDVTKNDISANIAVHKATTVLDLLAFSEQY